MKVLCLMIPHLPVQWELKKGLPHPPAAAEAGVGTAGPDKAVSRETSPGAAPWGFPDAPGPALVIGGSPHERKPVIDCSGGAAASGVRPGMTLRAAWHRCPDAIFLPADDDGYARAFETVLDLLDRFSPIVEADGSAPGKAFIDITGANRLFGPDAELAEQIIREVLGQTGFRSRAGVAGSKFVAGTAASLAEAGPLIVGDGEEKMLLEPLPIDLLPVSRAALAWLRRLGLRRLGQVAALPEHALAGPLGAEGITAHRLANGIDPSPVVPRPRPDILEQALSFDPPLESREALLAALDRLLARLVPLLRKRYQVCGEIRLLLASDTVEPDSVRPRPDAINLKIPLDSKPEILGILTRHLETASFPEGVSEVRLGLARLGGEAGRQRPLSSGTKVRQSEVLQRLEKDLEGRFGQSALKRVVVLDPGSRIPERRMALIDAGSGEEHGAGSKQQGSAGSEQQGFAGGGEPSHAGGKQQGAGSKQQGSAGSKRTGQEMRHGGTGPRGAGGRR